MAPAEVGEAPIRAVLFDLGGTLLDVRDPIGWAEDAEAVGLRIEPDDFTHWYDVVKQANDAAGDQIPLNERWHRIFNGALGGSPDADRFHAFLRRSQDRPGTASLFSDVRNCLDRLTASRRRLGVISNSPSESGVRATLGRAEIDGYFEVVLAAGTEGVAKPDPEIFLRAVRRLELSPNEVCYVGDLRNVDVRAARSAGLRALWLNRDGTGFSDETWEITSLSEVQGAVARGGGR